MAGFFKDNSLVKTAFQVAGAFSAALIGEPQQMGYVAAGNLYDRVAFAVKDATTKKPAA